MFLGVRIFIFLQKQQKIKTEQQTFQTFVDVFLCFYLSVFIHLLPIFFYQQTPCYCIFLILKSNKIEQNPTCLHCIENTELVG